jgi:hypothetical protein
MYSSKLAGLAAAGHAASDLRRVKQVFCGLQGVHRRILWDTRI